jgi:hypothetical protein
MRKIIVSLAPLAAALVLFAAFLIYMFDHNPDLARLSLAIFLFGHGWVHVTYLVPQRNPAAQPISASDTPFRIDRSWVLGPSHVDARSMRMLGTALVALVMIGFALAALATIGLLVPTSLWGGLVVVSSVASLVLLGIYFSPQLTLGVAINICLIWLVAVVNWSPVGS